MNRRHVVALLGCAAIVFACAPHGRATPASETRRQPAQAERSTQSHDTSALALSVQKSDGRRAMEFALELRNTGKLTEVRFASGQTHDFVVIDEMGREVWRWSEGRLFTQSLQTKQMHTGDVIRYSARWDTAAPGKYRVIASLNSAAHSEPIEREFVVH